MERTLASLFDYQRFAQNPRLQSIIDDTHRRCTRSRLSDEQLELVSAAGDSSLLAQQERMGEKQV